MNCCFVRLVRLARQEAVDLRFINHLMPESSVLQSTGTIFLDFENLIMVYITRDCQPPAGEALGKSVSTIGEHDVLV